MKQQVNEKLKQAGSKPIIALSEFHRLSRIKYMTKLIYEGDMEPGTAVTFNPHTLIPLNHGKKRVGHPRLNWFQVTIQDVWKETKANIDAVKFAATLDLAEARHINAIKQYATQQQEKNKK